MRNNKGFASILVIGIIVLLAAIGGSFGVYYFNNLSNKNTEKALPTSLTSNTSIEVATTPNSVVKKYTPEDLGFMITLPSGWNYEAINSSMMDIKAAFKYSSPDAKQSFVVSVFSDKDPEKITLAQWAKQDATNYDSQAKQDETFAKIGKNSGSIYSGEVNGRIYKRMYLIRGVLKEIYSITVEIDKNNSWISKFDQIITTFNFFEPKTDINITYKNLQFSFEITHPSTWRAREESDSIRLRNYYTPILDLPIDPVDITINYMKDENPNQLSIREWLKVESNNVFVSYEKLRQDVSLGDEAIRSVRDSYSKTPGKSIISYLIKNGKDIIQATYATTDNTKYVKNPNQVIETLKFTPFDQNIYSKLINEETKKIIGEDKNNNGVWDYIENYINQKYPYSGKIRMALYQYAKAEQQFLIDNKDEQKSLNNIEQLEKASDCLDYIVSKNKEISATPDGASKITSDVRAQLLNTKERSLAYINADGQLSGHVFSGSDSAQYKSHCDFDPDSIPN